mmetsp:Transcript_124024/g.356051  ORF Transcript_124024/g.356051 Transcript_124024/m.356051 type:complete len:113 (-) Transcript_124024:149-487(-)
MFSNVCYLLVNKEPCLKKKIQIPLGPLQAWQPDDSRKHQRTFWIHEEYQKTGGYGKQWKTVPQPWGLRWLSPDKLRFDRKDTEEYCTMEGLEHWDDEGNPDNDSGPGSDLDD